MELKPFQTSSVVVVAKTAEIEDDKCVLLFRKCTQTTTRESARRMDCWSLENVNSEETSNVVGVGKKWPG